MSFAKYNPEDVTVSVETVVAPLWSGGLTTLSGSNFFTSSTQENSSTGQSFLNVYQLDTPVSGSTVQMSLAYGHVSGSGSTPFNALVPNLTPTRDIYGQFRNLIYGDENAVINFGGAVSASRDFFVVSIARSRYKEGLLPGSLNLTLSNSSGSLFLTDNSGDTVGTNFIGNNEYFYIVSGSGGHSYNGTAVQTISGSYGLFFPNIATLLLNPRALSLVPLSGGLNVSIDETASTSYTQSYSTNDSTLFKLMKTGGSFSLQSSETVSSAWYFTRVKNQEFNYTTNPSIIDNNGNILFSTLVSNPQTYPTTIGLYNDNNDLLAVAQLNKPIKKTFSSELLISIKLSF